MQVIKRSGEVVEFDPDKIYQAVLKAAQTVYVLTDDLRQNLAQVRKWFLIWKKLRLSVRRLV
jgi:transcriptional regulator NrdR family protein